jgi:hypothetical protein
VVVRTVSRGAKRARVRLPVTARFDGGGANGFICRTRDVSEHGVLLETPELFPIETPLWMSLFDEQTGAAIELEGVVARVVPLEGASPQALGVKLTAVPAGWQALVARVHAERQGRQTSERPIRRLRILVVADEMARRGAVALYVTSGWDVRFASDLASTEEALKGIPIDAVIVERDAAPRWTEVLEAVQRAQPHARRIVRSSMGGHGSTLPDPGGPEALVHHIVDQHAGLEAILEALAEGHQGA